MHVGGVRGHLYELVLSFNLYVDSRNLSKVLKSAQQALYPLSHLIHPANSLPIASCCPHQLLTFFLGVGSLCIVSIKHGCVWGICSGMNRNQPIQGTHLMVTPEGTTKSRGFRRPNAEDYISCFKSIIVGHKGQYHGCHQVKVEW